MDAAVFFFIKEETRFSLYHDKLTTRAELEWRGNLAGSRQAAVGNWRASLAFRQVSKLCLGRQPAGRCR